MNDQVVEMYCICDYFGAAYDDCPCECDVCAGLEAHDFGIGEME